MFYSGSSGFYQRLFQTLVPFLAAATFIVGLIYVALISNSNSQNLAQIQRNTYPLLEKSNQLKYKLKEIQAGFYYAVTQEDPHALLRVKSPGTEFLDLLNEIEPLVNDQQVYHSIRSLYQDYYQLSEEVSRIFIEKKETTDSAVDLEMRVSEKSRMLIEAIEKLNRQEKETFEKRLESANRNSRAVLHVGAGTVISGMMIISAFLWFIMVLNQRLVAVNQTLKNKVAELESFGYTVSHDLKSPVVSIQGMASIFLEDFGEKLDDRGKYYIGRIMANSSYMEELIQGLLTLSRVGRKRENIQRAQVKDVVKDVLTGHKELFRDKKIESVVEEPFPVFVYDRVQLNQLFQNLVINAVKFMGNPPFPKIIIGGREYKDRIEYFVKDNGIGISQEYHEKIFGVFQRLQEVEVEGTGIGLSIVKKIMDLAGGKIWVQSRKGEGATFFISFPRNILSPR